MKKLILILLTPIILPLSLQTEEVILSNEQVKEFVKQQPYDFNQIKKDAKLIEFDLQKKQRRFQIVDVETLPTKAEIRTSIILHTLDVATTIYALEHRDEVKEGNLILGPHPEIHEVILLKALVLPFVHQNFEREQLVVMNWAGGLAVVNNLYIIHRYD
tara:strand:- start:1544 stop:2020 length:477 start_codon:yes stop_codon:yes gene_type:complete